MKGWKTGEHLELCSQLPCFSVNVVIGDLTGKPPVGFIPTFGQTLFQVARF
jgi:hypothetical protein